MEFILSRRKYISYRHTFYMCSLNSEKHQEKKGLDIVDEHQCVIFVN